MEPSLSNSTNGSTKSELVESLVRLESAIVKDLRKLGWDSAASGMAAVAHLSALDLEVLKLAHSDLQIYSSILPEMASRFRGLPGRSNGLDFFQTALGRMGLTCDGDFVKSVGPDDIVEVYNSSMRQVFRNFEFLTLSGYTLIEVCTVPWYGLWSRPKRILDAMNERVGRFFAEPAFGPLGIERHLLSEVYAGVIAEMNGTRRRTYTVTLKNIGPIWNSDGSLYGFAASSSAEIVAEGKAAEDLHFI